MYLLKNTGKATAGDAEKEIRKLEQNALDDLIDRRLILDEFNKMGGQIQEKYIDQSVDRFVEDRFGGDRDRFLKQLSQQQIPLEKFRNHQREQIAIEALRSKYSSGSTSTLTDLNEKLIDLKKRKENLGNKLKELRKNAKIIVDPPQPKAPSKSERYGQLIDNPYASPIDAPLSTFSVDVDTASYTNIRRMIQDGNSIPADAVRIEEMINYFNYDYPQPKGKHPFAFAIETAECPWNEDHQLMRVGIQGKEMKRDARPPANLVFLLDVSGSMTPQNKLPLVQKSMSLLVEELTENDTISVVVYAGAEGLCLPPTKGDQAEKNSPYPRGTSRRWFNQRWSWNSVGLQDCEGKL